MQKICIDSMFFAVRIIVSMIDSDVSRSKSLHCLLSDDTWTLRNVEFRKTAYNLALCVVSGRVTRIT